jgi:hypothetical protein
MAGKGPAGAIRKVRKAITVNFIVDGSAAHASADLLAQPMKLEGAAFGDHYGSVAKLMTVAALDKDGQSQNLTVVFQNTYVENVGTLNAAPNIDGTALESFVGFAQVSTWEDLGTIHVGCIDDIGLEMQADSNGDLYAWLLSKGTGTYQGGKITVIFTFEKT